MFSKYMENIPQPTNQLPVLQTILKVPYGPNVEAFGVWLKEHTHNYLIGEHPPGVKNGNHCHILIQGLKVTREALRKQVIKIAPGKGQNCTMASTQDDKKPYDTDLLAIYIIKGHAEYAKSHTFTPDVITEWASKWETRTITHAETHGATAPVKKAPTIYENCNEILDDLGSFKTDSALDRTEIVRATIAWANRKRKALHSVQVMNYYDCILQQGVPEYYGKLCVDLINRRHRD